MYAYIYIYLNIFNDYYYIDLMIFINYYVYIRIVRLHLKKINSIFHDNYFLIINWKKK